MEYFYTVQGEGAYSGAAAYFIRLGGCDVGCVWCDVKESWDRSAHPELAIDQIVENAKASQAPIVVITGGEPLMYDLTELTLSLKSAGLRTHIETSGAHPLTGDWDWICFSPKKFKKPLPEFYTKSHELKVIIYNRSDFKWAQEHAEKMHQGSNWYVQPEWSKESEMLPSIIQFVKENPKWRISLQVHKYMSIP
ncbi:MAG: 7-carboxy-7-deazaguanine synthase QueE [Cytophagales bacterium]|nr:7-carboxy-7-deazaguanine synthase QueE [Cytophagales bacterium]